VLFLKAQGETKLAPQLMILDPNAVPLTGDEMIVAINAGFDIIDRAGSVDAAARPITAGEVTNTELDDSAAKDNLDAMADADRVYIKTDPGVGEFAVYAIEVDEDTKLAVKWDDGL
jgi:hypothetical protein